MADGFDAEAEARAVVAALGYALLDTDRAWIAAALSRAHAAGLEEAADAVEGTPVTWLGAKYEDEALDRAAARIRALAAAAGRGTV